MQTNYEDLFAGELRNELKAQNEDLNTNDMKIAKPSHPETIKTVKQPVMVSVEIVSEEVKPAEPIAIKVEPAATADAQEVEEKPVTKRGRKKKAE